MTKAAELLHVTQPTLSKQLKNLEEELGKKLFTRHSFSIALTEEAQMEQDKIDTIMRNIERYDGTSQGQEDVSGRW